MTSFAQALLTSGHNTSLRVRGRDMLASDGTALKVLVEPALPPLEQYERPEKSRMEYLNLYCLRTIFTDPSQVSSFAETGINGKTFKVISLENNRAGVTLKFYCYTQT